MAEGRTSRLKLRCYGVPHYPDGKQVTLTTGQVFWSAAAKGVMTFVEPEGMIGIIHYEMTKTGTRKLTGTATFINSADWTHESAPATCTILR